MRGAGSTAARRILEGIRNEPRCARRGVPKGLRPVQTRVALQDLTPLCCRKRTSGFNTGTAADLERVGPMGNEGEELLDMPLAGVADDLRLPG
jgi:hypothetical protein